MSNNPGLLALAGHELILILSFHRSWDLKIAGVPVDAVRRRKTASESRGYGFGSR